MRGISSQMWVTQKSRIVETPIRELMQDKQFEEDLNETERNAWLLFNRICKDFVGNKKQRNIRMLCRTYWPHTKLWDAIWVWKSTFWSHTWIFFQKKSRRSQWRTWWKISPGYYGYGKAVPRHVDLKYVGRLLLDTEEVCTWCQIPVKIICLYIIKESFFLFFEHVKYYFAHLNSCVSFKPCLIEKFCIHIWIQQKKYC